MVILADADMDTIVDWAMIGIFYCTGQVCSATSRIIIDESIADDFCERLKKAVEEKLVVGDPLDASSNMGPMVSADQRAKVLEAVAVAHADPRCESLVKNPSSTMSASANSNGYYVEPQMFLCKRGDNGEWPEVWNEEVFGPVLSIGTFSSGNVDEAVEMANASPYAGALFFLSIQSAMYANVNGNVAEKMPLNESAATKTCIFLVNANRYVGMVVPSTVSSRQYFLPARSLNLPKRGQLTKARSPLIVSISPTTR